MKKRKRKWQKRNFFDKRSGKLGEDNLYNDWRDAVYKRDKHTCVACKKKSKFINAHHLDGWNWCVVGRYEIRNGVTLCSGKEGCHEHFHKLYGKGHNTRAQFDEYLRHFHGKTLGDVL